VLLRAGSVCTAKRNKPRVHNHHTLRKVSLLSNKNEHNLFPGLHSSNRFMKLIIKVADRHSDAINYAGEYYDVRTVESSACGRRSAEFFFYFVRLLVSDRRSDSNRLKIDSIKSPPSEMRKVGLKFGIEIVEYLRNFG